MDKGEGDLKQTMKDMLNDLKDNEMVGKIKDHDYIKVSGQTCKINFTVFNRSFSFSLCEWEHEISLFGNILMGLVSLFGMVHILRR
ncbi:hypothetical protein C4J81_00360 [Deltaproteobacteria bacterium Smac51]|nr:hypothetical protein C4J81_00280 [Deltaproteobacteria bacterium Smac51]UQZ87750.1 hypothetical protein C4J81_00360 [Deltaproteobacteria bacterium Smac51]